MKTPHAVLTEAVAEIRRRGHNDKAIELDSVTPAADAADADELSRPLALQAIAHLHGIGLEAISNRLSADLGVDPLPGRNLAGNHNVAAVRVGDTATVEVRPETSAVVPPPEAAGPASPAEPVRP